MSEIHVLKCLQTWWHCLCWVALKKQECGLWFRWSCATCESQCFGVNHPLVTSIGNGVFKFYLLLLGSVHDCSRHFPSHPPTYIFLKSWLLTFSYAFYFILSLSKWEIAHQGFQSLGKPFSIDEQVFLEEKSPDNTIQNLLSCGRASSMLSEGFSGCKRCLGYGSQP